MSIDRLRARIGGTIGTTASLPPTDIDPDHVPTNQRNAVRKPSRMPGLIFPGGTMASIPCTIADQSIGGARLIMQPGWVNPFRGESSLKERLTLVMRLDRVEVECEIVRIEDNEMGVKFLSMMRPLSRKI